MVESPRMSALIRATLGSEGYPLIGYLLTRVVGGMGGWAVVSRLRRGYG